MNLLLVEASIWCVASRKEEHQPMWLKTIVQIPHTHSIEDFQLNSLENESTKCSHQGHKN